MLLHRNRPLLAERTCTQETENTDEAVQDLPNLPIWLKRSVPTYADGSVQSVSVADTISVGTTAPQSVTLGSACSLQSVDCEISTAKTQVPTCGITQVTTAVPVSTAQGSVTIDSGSVTENLQTDSTAQGSVTIDSGSVTENLQNTANPFPQNTVVALGKVNAKTIYSRDISTEVQTQYLKIETRLIEGLRKYLARKKKSKKGLTLTLMMLGQNPHNNEPHIVLTCEPGSEKCVSSYLHKKRIEPIWRGEHRRGFKLEIATMIPRPAAHEALGDEMCNILVGYHHNGKSLFATIGGNVILCYSDGSFQQYGLTVNHLFYLRRDDNDDEDIASCCSDSASEASNDSIESDESICSNSKTNSSQDSEVEHRLDVWESTGVASTGLQQSQGDVVATSGSERTVLGTLVPKTFVSRSARDRDWALIEYAEQPSVGFNMDSTPYGNLEAAKFDPFGGPMPVSVVYRGTPHAGRLNAAPTSTIVPGGSSSISVYTFSFDEAPVDTRGISGSWIFRASGQHVQIYGQVVATDGFGGLQIVPIVDILQDIQQVFKVDQVYLHGCNGVSKETKRVPPAQTSLRIPESVSSDSKRGGNPSEAMNEEASSSDPMRLHPGVQANAIDSSEIQIPPVEHKSKRDRFLQAANTSFDVSAKQQTEYVFDNDHPHELSSMNDLDITQRVQGWCSEAEEPRVQWMNPLVPGYRQPDMLTNASTLESLPESYKETKAMRPDWLNHPSDNAPDYSHIYSDEDIWSTELDYVNDDIYATIPKFRWEEHIPYSSNLQEQSTQGVQGSKILESPWQQNDELFSSVPWVPSAVTAIDPPQNLDFIVDRSDISSSAHE
ncbi:hypothetical protein OPT61_g8839 [Boeremia exigua]|uniref:Uncharacterized protein n=1 Tax=Boeremia exigua TaxID=749465 RepID=A0ACC2HWK1_9PLEO|nr:hypothetical protein OPT61_g8839 [Boeremia exigua]